MVNSLITKKKNASLPKVVDFSVRQIDIFRGFLCNTDAERDSLSNVFDLWDSIPRYVVSRQLQDKWRKAGDFPQLFEIPFHYRGRELVASIQTVSIKGKDGVTKSYLPSANEEIIEDVLRKIASEQNHGFYKEKNKSAGVSFTLYMLRNELKNRGHERSYKDIMLSLLIMGRCVITTSTSDNIKGDFTSNSLYLNGLTGISKGTLEKDPNATWMAEFHPFASRALDELTYRQFNYARLMSHRNQLSRWLNKVLCIKYVQASFLNNFEIRFSTIKRDSGMLTAYTRERDAISVVDAAFAELSDCVPPLLGGTPKKKVVTGKQGKIVDVIYELSASKEFISEVKAANKRKQLAEQQPRNKGL